MVLSLSPPTSVEFDAAQVPATLRHLLGPAHTGAVKALIFSRDYQSCSSHASLRISPDLDVSVALQLPCVKPCPIIDYFSARVAHELRGGGRHQFRYSAGTGLAQRSPV